jgi:UDP-N-acetylmuramoyl-tripeptide--D-alanyl-D-alanine ligase
MIELSLGEIATAIGAEVRGDAQATVSGSVETDSRLVAKGSLFFAKPGEVTDGHAFIDAAKQAGAVAAVVEHFVESEIPQLKVASSVEALGKLAAYVLERVREAGQLRVVGVTGSNGKTTTKNMLSAIFSAVGETVAPVESFNNEVGAPISILRITKNTRYLVVEMGAGGAGSIRYLAKMARPDVGIVLKVGLAHVGEFGGIENTAAIKSELVEELEPTTIAILNADDAYVRDMAAKTRAKTAWFGTSDAGYQASDIALTERGTEFQMKWPDGHSERVALQILGEHHVMNALAALAAADQLGVSRSVAVDALEALPLAERWRMQVSTRSDGVTIINDAYNASPDSMRAALQTLAQLGKRGHRTIAVLGEMAELGEFSREAHDSIGRLVVRLNIDQLFVIGQAAKLIHMGASQEGSWDGESRFFETIEEAFDVVSGMLVSGDIVLVKSSKSANLRHFGDDLVEVQK